MTAYMENIAKGRFVELFNRVKTNDPTNSAIILVPLSASGSEAEAQDYDNLSTFLGGTANEATGSTWARKVLTDADLSAIAVDDTNNRFPASIPQQTWAGVAAANNTTGLAVCYDGDTTGGDDTNIIVICHLDFVVTTDGNDVVINAGDVARAS